MRTARGTLLLCVLVLMARGSVRAQPLEVEGAQRAEFNIQTGVWTLQGAPVRVRRGEWWVEARGIRYRSSDTTFEAEGPIRAQQAEVLSAVASRARGSVRESWVELQGEVQLHYRTGQGTAVLRAPRVWMDFGRRTGLASGGVELVWQEAVLRADNLSMEKDVFVARGRPVARWERLRLEAGWMRAALDTAILWALDGVRGEDSFGTFRSHEAEVRWGEQLVRLIGAVHVYRDRDRLEADEVRYEWKTGRATAFGRARVVVYP